MWGEREGNNRLNRTVPICRQKHIKYCFEFKLVKNPGSNCSMLPEKTWKKNNCKLEALRPTEEICVDAAPVLPELGGWKSCVHF